MTKKTIQKSAILNFPKSQISSPVISHLVRDYDLEINILQAHITPETDGHMFAVFCGPARAVTDAFACMKKRGIGEASLIEGATPAGGAALVEWLANGSPCVAY